MFSETFCKFWWTTVMMPHVEVKISAKVPLLESLIAGKELPLCSNVSNLDC